ncbi:MAG: hypothetical protein Q9201_004463 [Fulgogasparrea decipioides]
MAPTSYPHGLSQVAGFWGSIFAIPLGIGILWYILSHWGWWKLRRHGARRPLVRTWHGWVESSNQKGKTERNRLRKPPPRIIPRSTRADYSWIFWDPTGQKRKKFEQEREESVLRFVPRWMRSSAFGSANADVQASHDIEAARPSKARGSDYTSSSGHLDTLAGLGRQWGQRWWRGRSRTTSSDIEANRPGECSENHFSNRTSATEQNTVEDNVTTVRLRKPIRRSGFEWKAHSEDVERATNTQLFTPTAACNLERLFQPPNTVFYGSCDVQEPYLSRRIRTWTYGLGRSQSRSVSLLDTHTDTESVGQVCHGSHTTQTANAEVVEQPPCEESSLRIRKRGETTSTDNTTAAAEMMSIVDVPFHSTQEASNTDAQEHEMSSERDKTDEMLDADSFCSLPSSFESMSTLPQRQG